MCLINENTLSFIFIYVVRVPPWLKVVELKVGAWGSRKTCAPPALAFSSSLPFSKSSFCKDSATASGRHSRSRTTLSFQMLQLMQQIRAKTESTHIMCKVQRLLHVFILIFSKGISTRKKYLYLFLFGDDKNVSLLLSFLSRMRGAPESS